MYGEKYGPRNRKQAGTFDRATSPAESILLHLFQNSSIDPVTSAVCKQILDLREKTMWSETQDAVSDDEDAARCSALSCNGHSCSSSSSSSSISTSSKWRVS